MARVPVLDPAPSVQPTGAPAPDISRLAFRDAASGAASMENLGQTLERAGSNFGQLAAEHQATINEAAVKGYDADLVQKTTDLLHNPDSGYLNMQGADAVNGRQAAIKSLQDMSQSISDNIQNPRQQEMFKQIAAQRFNASLAAIDEHASQQGNKYAIDSGMARAQASSDAATRAYNPVTGADNTIYRQAIATQKQELGEIADRLGLKDALRDQFMQQQLGKTYAGVVGHLVDNNQSAGARDFLASVRDQLSPEVADKLAQTVKAGTDRNDALTTALAVKSKTSDINQQEKDLDAQFSAGKITSDIHDMALQHLRADNAQRRSEEAENDRVFMGNLWGQVKAGNVKSITDLSPTQLAYVRNRALGDRVDTLMRKDFDPTRDAQVLTDMTHMAAETPYEFAKMDTSSLIGTVSPGVYDKILGMQTGINKADAKQMEQTKLVSDTLHSVKGMMPAALQNPKSNSDKQEFAKFNGALIDALNSAQTAQGDKPLTNVQAREIALGMVKDRALSGRGWIWGDGPTKPTYQLVDDIPDNDRTQIVQALQGAGKPVTPDAVVDLYNRMVQSKKGKK